MKNPKPIKGTSVSKPHVNHYPSSVPGQTAKGPGSGGGKVK